MVDKSLYYAITALQKNTDITALTPVITPLSHEQCMMCGIHNSQSLKIAFYTDKTYVWAMYKNNKHQQGFTHIAHGGFIVGLLDAVMCQSLFAQQVEAVTADLSVRYLHEIPVNSTIVLKGKVISSRKNLYKVQGELFVDQQLMAKSDARFMKKTNIINEEGKNEKGK